MKPGVRRAVSIAMVILLSAVLVFTMVIAATPARANSGQMVWLEATSSSVSASDKFSYWYWSNGQPVTVELHRKVGSSWKRVESFTATPKSQYWQERTFHPAQVTRKAGKTTYRVRAKSTNGKWEQKTFNVRVKNANTLSVTSPKYVHSTAKNRTVSASVFGGGQKVTLQYKNGKSWKTLRTVKTKRAYKAVTVRFTVPAKAGNRTYRVVTNKSSLSVKKTSKGFTVHQTDSKKHRAYIAKARSYIKKYCPSTPIYIDTELVRGNGNIVGMATLSWRYTGSDAHWEQAIHLQSGMSTGLLRHTAQHECAHIIQNRRLIDKGYASYEKYRGATSNKIYKGSKSENSRGPGLERQADCMALAMNKNNAPYMYYANHCKGKRLTEAKKQIKAYGKKYQSPNQKWTWKN